MHNVNSKNNNRTFALISLIISVLGISISFFAMSSSLKINDYKEPQTYGWNMGFNNLSGVTLEGDAKELNSPYIENNSTVIKNFAVEFNKLNDSASYSFAVENNGILDAKVSSITKTKPICYGSGENALEDAEMVCDNIEVSLKYDNDEEIKVGDILDSKKSNNLNLKIEYKSKNLPKNTVNIENISITVVYVQK